MWIIYVRIAIHELTLSVDILTSVVNKQQCKMKKGGASTGTCINKSNKNSMIMIFVRVCCSFENLTFLHLLPIMYVNESIINCLIVLVCVVEMRVDRQPLLQGWLPQIHTQTTMCYCEADLFFSSTGIIQIVLDFPNCTLHVHVCLHDKAHSCLE